MIFDITDINSLSEPANYILQNNPNGGLFFLRGTLASGKTTFVKTFAKNLGITNTSSPTFSLINCYGDKIYHYDLYQIKEKQISMAEIVQNFFEDGWHFVEWADEETERLAKAFGLTPKWNDFCIKNEKRYIEIEQ